MAASELRQRVVDLHATEAKSTAGPAKAASSSDEIATFTPPTFTIKDLLSAIPEHCYERSALKSSGYVLMDFAMIGALGYAASNISTYLGTNGSLLDGRIGQLASYAAWATYWWFSGLIMTGVWVIAHECGHQAYSTSKTINNSVGWFLHSALLVPYHSWRISHAKHHAATGHMTRDQVFVPKTASQVGVVYPRPATDASEAKNESILEKVDDLLEDAPLYLAACLVGQQLLGWPMYLIRNASGQKTYPRGTNHFNPQSVIFEDRHYWQIIMSDIGLGLACFALYTWAQMTSWTTVIAYYGIPYLLVNHWLVLITFLQHTDPMLPHYRGAEWNFQRGALCTQDRNVYNFFTHKIANTHVLHHLKSSIPHYHASEATEALKKVLGPHYLFSEEHWLVSLYKSYRDCRFVPDEGDIIFFRDAQGRAKREVVYDSPDSAVEVQ